MNHHSSNQFRLLAIALTSRGLGYAVLEGEKSLVESSHTSVRKGDKNKECLKKVEQLAALYRPDVLVLQDVTGKGSRRAPRIKRLHSSVISLARKHKIKAELVSGEQVRSLILGESKGTKHQMAEMLAKYFPDELASRLPPKRRAWQSADSRMDIFDAVALAVAFRMRESTEALDLGE